MLIIFSPVMYSKEFVTYTLPNEATLIVLQDKSLSKAVIDTWFSIGSIDESPDLNGMSHFLEHVMFKSEEGAISFDTAVEQFGGHTNAATSKEYTHYYYVVPKSQVRDAVSLHLKMLFNPSFPDKSVKDEQVVVQEEIHRALNAPFRALFDEIYVALYSPDRRMTQTVLATPKDIATFNSARVKQYYNSFYTPKQATILIASPENPDIIYNHVKSVFPSSHSKPRSSSLFKKKISYHSYNVNWPSLESDLNIVYAQSATLPTLLWAFPEPVPNATLTEKMAFEVFLYMLSTGPESILQKAVVDQSEEGAYSIGSSWVRHRKEGYAFIYMMVDQKALPKSIERLTDALSETCRFSSENLRRVKRIATLGLAQEQSNAEEYISSYGEAIVMDNVDEWKAQEGVLNSLTISDVLNARQAAYERLNIKQARFLLLPESMREHENKFRDLLKDAVLSPHSEGKDVVNEHNVNEPNSVVLENLHKMQNQVYVKSLPQSTLVHSAWHFQTSSMPTRHHAALQLLEALWLKQSVLPKEGDPVISVSDYLQSMGVSVSFFYEPDVSSVHFETLNDNAAALVQVQDLLFTHKNALRFDDAAFNVERRNALKSIELLNTSPQSLIQAYASKALGTSLPFGLQLDELKTALEATSPQDVYDVWDTLWTKSPATLTLAGNKDLMQTVLTGMNLVGLLEHHPTPKAINSTNTAMFKLPIGGVQQHVLKADQATTWLLWGWGLPSVHHADMPALQLIQAYLSQGMSAVIFQEVREKRGLAYEVAATLDPNYTRSTMSWYAGVKPENVETTEAVFQEILQSLLETPLTAETLDAVKQKKIGSFQMGLESPSQWATLLGRVTAQGLGMDYIDNYEARLSAVTPEHVHAVANKYLTTPDIKLTLGKALDSPKTKEAPLIDD